MKEVKKKNSYVAPEVKTYFCCIEKGFAGSQIVHNIQDVQVEDWIKDDHSDISNFFGEII